MNTEIKTVDNDTVLTELQDKEYRDLFVVEHIQTSLPFQTQALREQRGWSQKDLGERTGMTQKNISRIEDPDYGKLNLRTLLRLASAFDVALFVRFVPFSFLINWTEGQTQLIPGLSHDARFAPSFGDEFGKQTNPVETAPALPTLRLLRQEEPEETPLGGRKQKPAQGYSGMEERSNGPDQLHGVA